MAKAEGTKEIVISGTPTILTCGPLGIQRYYDGTIPLRDGIIFYENRDMLEHHLSDIEYDETMMKSLLAQVEAMREWGKEGRLLENSEPWSTKGNTGKEYLITSWRRSLPSES